jgi:hypothetical protein
MACLTKKEIKEALPHWSFTRSQKRSRAALTEAVTSLLEGDHIAIQDAARAKKRRQMVEVEEQATNLPRNAEGGDGFFETVSEDVRRVRISKFIAATGKNALATMVCVVCAGHFYCESMTDMSLNKLQTDRTLAPSVPHPAHILMEGMLLYTSGDSMRRDDQGQRVARTCGPCKSSLHKKKTPALSLANGMWISDMPLELKILTLPEQVLVAHHFPAAYIMKLFPKKKGAHFWAGTAGLHSGLQGNVSTYHLNTSDVANMMGNRTMPPPCRILAATVGVTFVGPCNLPEKTLLGFL